MSLAETTLADLLGQLAAKTPSPGGGAAGPIAGALSAALASMTVQYSLNAKGLEDHAQAHSEVLAELTRARAMLLTLADEDGAAYASLREALSLPRSDPQRATLLQKRALIAMQVPLMVIATATEMLLLFERLAPMTSRHLKSDLLVAAILTEAAARAARVMVEANVPLATEADGSRLRAEADELLERATARLASVVELCNPGKAAL